MIQENVWTFPGNAMTSLIVRMTKRMKNFALNKFQSSKASLLRKRKKIFTTKMNISMIILSSKNEYDD